MKIYQGCIIAGRGGLPIEHKEHFTILNGYPMVQEISMSPAPVYYHGHGEVTFCPICTYVLRLHVICKIWPGIINNIRLL